MPTSCVTITVLDKNVTLRPYIFFNLTIVNAIIRVCFFWDDIFVVSE